MAPPLSRSNLTLFLCIFIVILSLTCGRVCKDKPCRVKKDQPLCGTDGRNYTKCLYGTARCKAKNETGQIIGIKHYGYCNSTKPVAPCFWQCTSVMVKGRMICASNGRQYKNLCQFKRSKCRLRKSKKVKLLTMVNRKNCNKSKPSANCRDVNTCPNIWRPVCGSDNVTYNHICHLKSKNCNMKKKGEGKVILRYCGACGRPNRCIASSNEVCPSMKLCDDLLTAGCNTPSKKISNLKKLGLFKKKKKGKVGKGGKKRELPINGAKKKTSNKKNKDKMNAKKKRIHPKFRKFALCASDGRTYPSVCHFQVAQCHKRKTCQRLFIRHRGTCQNQ